MLFGEIAIQVDQVLISSLAFFVFGLVLVCVLLYFVISLSLDYRNSFTIVFLVLKKTL